MTEPARQPDLLGALGRAVERAREDRREVGDNLQERRRTRPASSIARSAETNRLASLGETIPDQERREAAVRGLIALSHAGHELDLVGMNDQEALHDVIFAEWGRGDVQDMVDAVLAAGFRRPPALDQADLCTCGLVEQERTGHAPQHADFCELSDEGDQQTETIQTRTRAVIAERDALRTRIAAVTALADEWERSGFEIEAGQIRDALTDAYPPVLPGGDA